MITQGVYIQDQCGINVPSFMLTEKECPLRKSLADKLIELDIATEKRLVKGKPQVLVGDKWLRSDYVASKFGVTAESKGVSQLQRLDEQGIVYTDVKREKNGLRVLVDGKWQQPYNLLKTPEQNRASVQKWRAANPEKNRAINKTRYHRLTAEGKCPKCRDDADTGTLCSRCWYKDCARRIFGSVNRVDDIKTICERDKFTCHYTGQVLKPGENLSFDHVVPRSSDAFPGPDVLDNIVVAHTDVNIAKQKLSVDEFVHLCELVTLHMKG